MKNLLILFILLFLCQIPAALAERIEPEDLTYLGAFRLPGASGGSDWGYSGSALTYYPGGDASGPEDGFPGSLYGIGHDHQLYLSEISIPLPIISPGKNPGDLNRAITLQPFANIRNADYDFIDMYNLPVVGLEYLPAQGNQQSARLHFCWGQHFQHLEPSHGWCGLDLSENDVTGPWYFDTFNNYTSSDYLFEIPIEWADRHVQGQRLASGRFREGVWSGYGPALYTVAPWKDGNPPAMRDTLHHITRLLLYGDDNPLVPEIENSESKRMQWYNAVDNWAGGVWLTAGNNAAVVLVGTKGMGDSWYGFSDGTVWPYEGPYPPVPPAPHDNRGYWADSIQAQIIFYDPDELAEVAAGRLAPHEPQPYAFLNLDPWLFNPGYDYVRPKYHLVGASAFDRERSLLYVFERLADEDNSLVHVWKVETVERSTQADPDIIQVIHCEPHNAHLLPDLVNLVAMADSFSIPLTIQLTPQWAQEMLASPEMIDSVRAWQARGHEIGAHHHGVEAGGGWDGYTDHPPEDFPIPQKYQGDMTEFLRLLNEVAGDSLVLSATIADSADWPQGIPFRTQGHNILDAISRPFEEILHGQTVWTLGMGTVTHAPRVDSLIQYFPNATDNDIVTAVAHVYNYVENTEYLKDWFGFIQDKSVFTHREVMRRNGYAANTIIQTPTTGAFPASIRLLQNYPNPFNPETTIFFDVARRTSVRMEIYNVLGKIVAIPADGVYEAGQHSLVFGTQELPSGMYLLRMQTPFEARVRKMVRVE